MKKQNVDKVKVVAPLLFKEGCPPKADGVVRNVVVPDKVIKIHSLPHLKTFRTILRTKLTPAEAFLWKQIQNSKFENQKFRRQHSIGNYIVDFYCPKQQLAIELDGEVHNSEAAQVCDEERDLFISYYGILVLRFENKQVFDNLEAVLETIKSHFIE
jgi:very-short-patch-repair endonuclease